MASFLYIPHRSRDISFYSHSIDHLPFPLVILLLYKTSALGNNINSYKPCELNPYHGLKTVLDAGHTLILCTLATNLWCATVKGKLHSFIHLHCSEKDRPVKKT